MSDQRWADIVYSEAIGEKLSPEDEAFKEAELRADPSRAAEQRALAALRAGLAGASPRAEDAALARQSVKRANDRHRRARQMVWTGAGVLAAAASVVIAVRMRPASTPSIVAASSPTAIDSRGACVHASTTAAVCFDNGSKLDGPTAPGQFRLARGHVVAALQPLPPGTEFSITTPHGKATVVGTQFAVDVLPDGTRTEVRVIKGKVRVDNATNGAQAFVEKGQFAILGDHLETGALTEPTPARDSALLALAKHEAGIADGADESVDESAKTPRDEGASAAEAPKGRHPGALPAQAATAADFYSKKRADFVRAGSTSRRPRCTDVWFSATRALPKRTRRSFRSDSSSSRSSAIPRPRFIGSKSIWRARAAPSGSGVRQNPGASASRQERPRAR